MAFLLVACLCSPSLVLAQTTVTEIQKTLNEGSGVEGGVPNYDKSITVHHVYIEGNTLVDEARLRNVMTLRPGVVYSKNALQSDL
ncbi:MAG: hypothetical protein LW809_01730, partial [Vampirovibrionales bacterium]|nr:hypothetical protein [Vampirovibrionales bacterium]